MIIGTVVLYLVIRAPDSEPLKNTINVLTGTLTSIIGFFFGGRAAESASEDGQNQKKQLEKLQQETLSPSVSNLPEE